MRRIIFAAVSVAAILAGCNEQGASSSPPAEEVGACYHIFSEPVLSISTAKDAADGGTIAQLALQQLTINGIDVSADRIAPASKNLEVKDGVMYCTLPCAFGSEEGIYRFRASATGYKAKLVETNANYAVFAGGCPSRSDQGSQIEIIMDKE